MIRNFVVVALICPLVYSCVQSAQSQPSAREPAAAPSATTRPVGKEPVDQLFLDAAVARLEHSKAYTLEVAQMMPESKYGFKPTPEEFSFAEQLLHIGSRLTWLTSQYIYKETNEPDPYKDPAKPYTKEEVIATVTQNYDYAIDKIKHFDVSHLTDSVYFEYMGANRMSKLQYINLLNDHQAHHRGQLMVYLHMNGITPPEYIGW